MQLDHYAPFVLWAFGITVLVLAGYLLFLRSRISGLDRALRQSAKPSAPAVTTSTTEEPAPETREQAAASR